MIRLAYTIAFVAAGVTLGKMAQYGAVELVGDRIGFEAASALGLTPILGAAIWLKNRHPRWFAFRREA